MNSKVSYLASRSLAVYEMSLLEQFSEEQKRQTFQQALKFAGLAFVIVVFALLALFGPILLQNFLTGFKP